MQNIVDELRRETNTSQEELAEACMVSRQTIISIEKGKYNPSIILAFRIANYFNKKIEDVFIYNEDDDIKI